MSKEHTRTTVEIRNESDDDSDDLDAYLDEFENPKTSGTSAPPPSATTTTPSTIIGNRPRHNTRVDAPPVAIPGTRPILQSTVEEEELDPAVLSKEFAEELQKGMESLMMELVKDLPKEPGSSSGPSKNGGDSDYKPGSETEQAFKAAWEAMLVEELNGAEGLDELLGKASVKPKADSKDPAVPANDFQSRIKQVMDKRKERESNLQAGSGTGTGTSPSPGSVEELLKSLGDLDLGEGGENDAELAGFIDSMMTQLMGKEVLYEPLKELADNFPKYLSNPSKPLESDDRTRYEKQHSLVKRIVAIFDKPDYNDSNEEDRKTIMELMSEMQNLGSPPTEIMGPLPPGFENGMPQLDENCVIG